MSSLFDDWYGAKQDPAAYDPVAAARLAMKPALPRRFYGEAAVIPVNGEYVLTLDGRKARTPGRALVAMPNLAVAEAVAREWTAQEDVIDPSTMPLTRLCNSIIDGIVPAPDAVVDEIVRYAGSDLLCYRAGEPESLVQRQINAWDPVLTWAKEHMGATFVLVEGVTFASQPERSLEAVRRYVPSEPWALGALGVITTLTGSALLALALFGRAISAEAAWEAAHVDEDHQTETWGADEEASDRRAKRLSEYSAAIRLLTLLG